MHVATQQAAEKNSDIVVSNEFKPCRARPHPHALGSHTCHRNHLSQSLSTAVQHQCPVCFLHRLSSSCAGSMPGREKWTHMSALQWRRFRHSVLPGPFTNTPNPPHHHPPPPPPPLHTSPSLSLSPALPVLRGLHTQMLASAPPTDTRYSSQNVNRTLVTWALWALYFLYFACLPE